MTLRDKTVEGSHDRRRGLRLEARGETMAIRQEPEDREKENLNDRDVIGNLRDRGQRQESEGRQSRGERALN